MTVKIEVAAGGWNDSLPVVLQCVWFYFAGKKKTIIKVLQSAVELTE